MTGRQAVSDDLLANLSDEQRQRVDDYLGQFQVPEMDELGQKCIECGAYFTGTLGVANFTIPGEGECYDCGHPFRYNHVIPLVGTVYSVPLMYKSRIIL